MSNETVHQIRKNNIVSIKYRPENNNSSSESPSIRRKYVSESRLDRLYKIWTVKTNNTNFPDLMPNMILRFRRLILFNVNNVKTCPTESRNVADKRSTGREEVASLLDTNLTLFLPALVLCEASSPN